MTPQIILLLYYFCLGVVAAVVVVVVAIVVVVVAIVVAVVVVTDANVVLSMCVSMYFSFSCICTFYVSHFFELLFCCVIMRFLLQSPNIYNSPSAAISFST